MRSKTFKRVETMLIDYKYNKARLETELEAIGSFSPGASANSDYSQPRPSNRKRSDKTGNTATANADFLMQLEIKIKKDLIEVRKIEKVLNLLDPIEHKLIEYRYFNDYTDYQTIAKMSNISSATYYRIKNDVIRKFSIVLLGEMI